MQVTFQHIQTLVDRIEANLADDVNVLGLADAFHMSPWHFQRTFKSLIGDTLGGYIRGRRLTRAAQLLLESHRSVIDIAVSVGFNSHEAFSRSFKAYFHVTPKAFRAERPAITLREKPLLTQELFQHLAEGMDQDPIITELPARHLIGQQVAIPSPFVGDVDYCDLLFTPWTDLLTFESSLPGRIDGEYFGLMVSPSGSFTEDHLFYLAAAGVREPIKESGDDRIAMSFPAQQVAMFDIFSGTEDTVAQTVDFIYGYWLPNSQYTRANGHDYEYFENVSDFTVPRLHSRYVLPIQPKT